MRTFWLIVAGVTLAGGFLRAALLPGRSNDLLTVHLWLRGWLIEGRNPYLNQTWAADYPPSALAAFGPLGVFEAGTALVMWAAINVVLAPLTGYVSARALLPQASRAEWRAIAILFAAWGSVLSGLWMGQFALITFLWGMLAIAQADRRRVFSGILLGLSLSKPQIGAAFAFWALFTGRFRMLAVAAATSVGLTLLVGIRLQESPFRLVQLFLEQVSVQLGGGSERRGVSELWVLAEHVVGPELAGVARVVSLVLLFVAVAWVGWRAATRDPQPGLVWIAFGSLWALAAIFHYRYDMILMLPPFLMLWSLAGRSSGQRERVFLWILQIALWIEVPWAWRTFGEPYISVSGAAAATLAHFDRLLVLACLLTLLAGATRSTGSERHDVRRH